MSFLRPEARDTLWRWREVLVGVAVLAWGIWFLVGPGRLLSVPGAAFVILGVLLVWVGVQRGRFRRAGDGVGVVRVDEGQISYFGPLTGGVIALRELERLSLDASHHPAHWRLEQPGQAALLIPVNASGSEALFDAFAALPGLKTERMLAEMQTGLPQAVVIWERRPLRPAHALLH